MLLLLVCRVETTCNVVGDTLAARTVAIWTGHEDELALGKVTGSADSAGDDPITKTIISPIAAHEARADRPPMEQAPDWPSEE